MEPRAEAVAPVNRELELDAATMTAMVDAVMARLTAFVGEVETAPVDGRPRHAGTDLTALEEALPETPAHFDALLDHIFDVTAPNSLGATSPGFMGFVPGGGLFHAAVADLIADTLNRYVGAAAVAPSFVQLEANVVRWFAQIVGYPATARGFLTSGGSLANLSALITARQTRLGDDLTGGVLYVSSQAHHCLGKAARMAGLPAKAVSVLGVDDRFRLRPGELRDAIRRDRARGLRPFCVAASAGTTNTGAVDPLAELADVARDEGVWLHVDGAYGGFFNLTARGRQVLTGLERADSIVLDPHKTLFLPYGTGALLVRDGQALRDTHASAADYMPPMQDDDALVDFCELSPELTRPFRGLRVWLPIKLHGAATFRAYLDEKLDLANRVADRVRQLPRLELLAAPELSILAFAVRGAGTVAERNATTRQVLEFINARNRVHLTATMLGDVYAIRVAIVAFRTHRERVDMLIEDLEHALAALDAPQRETP